MEEIEKQQHPAVRYQGNDEKPATPD